MAYLQHGVSEDRIPFRDLAVPPPLQGYRLRPIRTRTAVELHPNCETCSARLRTKLSTASFFTTLTRIYREYFQTRSEEVHTTDRPVEKGNIYLPEVMLAKFSGQAFALN